MCARALSLSSICNANTTSADCDKICIEFVKTMQGEKLKCKKIEFRRKARPNQFLSNLTAFEFDFDIFSFGLVGWFARTPLRMGIVRLVCWDMNFICVSHFKIAFIYWLGWKFNGGQTSRIKYWIYLFRAKSIFCWFFCWTSLKISLKSKWLKKQCTLFFRQK